MQRDDQARPLVATLGARESDLEALRREVAPAVIEACGSVADVASASPTVCVVVYGAADDALLASLSERAQQPALIVVRPEADADERALVYRLLRAELRADLAGSMADEFASLMAHELRGSLSTIGLAHDVLSTTLEGDKAIKPVMAIGRAVGAASRLLDRLRELVALNRSGLTLRRADLDARAIVDAAVEALAGESERRKISVRRVTGDRAVPVAGDQARLEQAVCELIAIALRHTRSGELVVALESRSGEAVFSVTGTGLAVADDQLERLFARVWRGPHGRGSLEFGASLARAIARGHGGWARARCDDGTRLELAVPLA